MRSIYFHLMKFLFMIMLLTGFSINILAAEEQMFNVTSYGKNYTEFEFNLSEYEFIPVEVDGTLYQRLYHPTSGFLMEEGLPELLSFSVILAVPATGTVDLETVQELESKVISDIQVFPSQGYEFEISSERGFLKNESFYLKNAEYPLQSADISEPAIMRDLRLVSITIYPFLYNPAFRELTVREKMSVRVNYNPDLPGINEILNPNPRLSRSFERIYQNSVVNYEQFRNRNSEYQARSILVIYHHNTTIVNQVNEFVTWKRDKGFEITAQNTANLTSNVAIKNYIQNAYDTWEDPPEYVVFIGGASGTLPVPAWNVNSGWGDQPYALLEGNDDLADVFVGRIAVDNATQLATIWNKIRNYERTPYLADMDWYERNLLVGDPGISGVSTIITNRYIKEIMTRHNSDYEFLEVYTSPFASQMNSGVNQGVSFFNFRGWSGMANWSPSDSALTNGLKLPNCVFLTCSTLSYTTSSSRTDYMVRMGTPTTSKGGVTAIGMTTSSTKTAFNNALAGGIFYGIFVEDMRTMGEALVRGKLNLWQNYGNSHPTYPPRFSQWTNLIGDPSMDIWVEEPKILNVIYEPVLIEGTNSIAISVTDENGQSLPGAWVTIRQGNDTIFATGYTDESGGIVHFFEPESSGTVSLTVTKPNYIPHLGSFEISGDPGVTFHNTIVNGDLVANTTVNFALLVKNHSDQTINGVSGTINSESDYVDVTSGTSNFGNIAAGTIAESVSDFVISIASDTPSGYRAVFQLTVTDDLNNEWQSRFFLNIQNGNLVIESYIVNDGGNGILDPGEQAQILLNITNNGLANLEEIHGIISGDYPGLVIIDSTAYFGNISTGQTVSSNTDHFILSAAAYLIPGMSFDLEIYLFNNQGFNQTRSVNLTIGEVTVDDPLGPDAYGYWCFDDGDTGYLEAPVYEWIEISPTLGGTGINTNLQSNHDDLQTVMNMPLPFNFTFYGQEYDQISICANGWISMGITEQATFRNWRLPGPLGPSSIIAAFWDNLSLANGGVYTHYDNSQNIFIIQWQNAQNIVNNSQETFQIILYDSMYHFTSTGDGQIKIQYKVFNNVNNTSGSPYGSWGNYSTVGIADHTCTVGLEYTFNNEYPTAARPLGNETAILFTTGSIDYDNAYIAIDTFSVSDDNNNIPEFDEMVHLNMSLTNIGALEAHNVSAILGTTDPYVTVVADSAFFGTLADDEISTVYNAYTVEIADNVPHMHRVNFMLSIIADNDLNWNHSFNLDINAPELVTLEPLIYDPAPGGNNNGLIDPGETLILYVPIKNSGGSDSPPVNISIVSNNPQVIINSISDTNFNSLHINQRFYPALNLTVDQNITIGSEISFDYTIESGSYTFTGEINTNVGGLVTAQMGSGTSTNSGTEGAPVNIYFRSLRGQMVYTAAELNAAGMNGAGSIAEFGFYVTSLPNHPLPNFIIRMKHTTATNASSHDNGPFETVYFTNSYSPVAGEWNMFTLDTPFAWDGISNILVDTAFAQVPSWSSSGQLRIYSVTNGYRFVRADHADQTNATTTTTSSNKPQAKIVIVTSTDGGNVIRPENLTAQMSGSQIQLQWEAPDADRNNEQLPGFRNNSLQKTARNDSSDRTERNNRTLLGYNVYRNGNQINSELVAGTVYYDPDVEPLCNYFYYVTAVFTEGESVPSNIVSIELANRVLTPEFSPPGGYYNNAQNIAITTDTENASIYYTIDGTEPDQNSILYDLPVEMPIETDVTLKAKGFRDDLLPSETGVASYHISLTIPTPSISPEAGIYQTPQTVSISLPDDIWNIYYTLDGTEPDIQSNLYTEPFTLNVSTTVKALGLATDWLPSETVTAHFTILNPPQNLAATPSYDNIYLEWEEPLMSSDNLRRSIQGRMNIHERSRIREDLIGYNIFRSEGNPDNMSQINDTPVSDTFYNDGNLDPGIYYYVVEAIFSEGTSNYSNQVAAEISIVAAPVITPPGGIYYDAITVEITTTTPDADIYYTLDGSEPTTGDILYDSPIEIFSHSELRVRAFKDDWLSSVIISADYAILYAPQNLTAESHIGYVILNWEEPWAPLSLDRDKHQTNSLRISRENRAREEKRNSRTLIGYNVYRAYEDEEFTIINDMPVTDTTYNDSDLPPGVYGYYVRAMYSEGESQPTETVTLNVGSVVVNPEFDPEPGTYQDAIFVSIDSETENSVIYFTLDGSDPDLSSFVYNEPVYIEETTTIKAFATLDDWQDSEIVEGLFIINPSFTDSDLMEPLRTKLHNAYPNPFNPSTTLSFTLKEQGFVEIDIFNISGQKIRTLSSGYMESGHHSIQWNGYDDQERKISSGIYFYRMMSKDYQAIKKIILLK